MERQRVTLIACSVRVSVPEAPPASSHTLPAATEQGVECSPIWKTWRLEAPRGQSVTGVHRAGEEGSQEPDGICVTPKSTLPRGDGKVSAFVTRWAKQSICVFTSPLGKGVHRHVGHGARRHPERAPRQALTWIFYQKAVLPKPGQNLAEISCKAKA